MSATVFQFGSAASTNPTGISNDFKFSFTFNSLTTATSNATSCFPFQPPSFQQQKPIMLKQQQSLFLPQQQQQQQQQSAGIFRLNPYKDSVTQEQPTGRKTTVFKDKHFTADQNKENIDPKTGAQPSAATKEKNVKRTRFGMSSGPLVDITTGYLNNSAPPEAPYRQVTSQFVGLGWGGEAFAENTEEQAYLNRRKHRRIEKKVVEENPIIFKDRPEVHLITGVAAKPSRLPVYRPLQSTAVESAAATIQPLQKPSVLKKPPVVKSSMAKFR